ncbi:MAG: preprotein translocase subunit SecG [Candidatus Kerfeldbacteria bacterium CG_4_10_14_0_8_um_filter_42_10]|uniref:Protein-export membrane protein SecG n=1 Tax=Candidatus Kerfeldbacteria bacterium CG_4_10_14_0_8_um_filter_42_10 TaxID=2014248 RepID=A0A2M7RI04_9BACT|nr:MAG: preprotein translocase subunit SecG [Candidatus Kerfeldbacteria bacterium CG_4_10_14_0_8_um_filter_42_10]
MKNIINIIQLVIAVILIVLILIQNRGAGLGGIFGGGGDGNVYRTKRGAERILFIATIVLATLFLGISLVNFVL